jgi:hypothetical protein
MSLQWAVSQDDHSTQHIHHSQYTETADAPLKHAIDNSIEKAIDLLPKNILDDSLYFLVEWDQHNSTLQLVVTDDTKQKEAPEVVRCTLTLADNKTHANIETIHFLVRDYLTTSSGFIRFSLVAVFGLGDRTQVELL